MAYEVCEHCMMSVCRSDAVVRDGHSYHKECNKCYVCSETNLQNAEIFKGVIFCSSCSQRIFQGCSTARQTKNTPRPKRTKSRPHHRRRERGRNQDKRSESQRSKLLRESGVIELVRLAYSTDTDSNPDPYRPLTRSSKTLALARELAAVARRQHLPDKTVKDMKQESTEIGMTTEFTQELLKQINCPVVEWSCRSRAASPVKPIKKNLTEDKRNKCICSDLRIAELGMSTEIANMALRKQSEMPVNEKLEIRVKRKKSQNLCLSSDVTASSIEDWLETARTVHRSDKHRTFDRTIGNIIKSPFSFFKNNIMNRSSLVGVLMTSQDGDRLTLFDRFKTLFHEEISEHHRSGVKRLYSTINRRKSPYKLGWLHLDAIESANKRRSSSSHQHQSSSRYKCSGCKHYRHSPSYRCLRAHIMKRAGPTKSELAVLRKKMVGYLSPVILTRLFEFMFLKHREAIMMSEACGNSVGHQNESKTPSVEM